jgi:hypothetical protein
VEAFLHQPSAVVVATGFGCPRSTKTPSQCVELARAAALERTPVPLSSAQRFIDNLSKMDFVTDLCPRHKDATCAGIMDGTNYIVQFEGGLSVRLTDVGGFSGMKSENPALSNWVTALLKEIGLP